MHLRWCRISAINSINRKWMGEKWVPYFHAPSPTLTDPNQLRHSPTQKRLKDKWPRVVTFIRKPLCKPQFWTCVEYPPGNDHISHPSRHVWRWCSVPFPKSVGYVTVVPGRVTWDSPIFFSHVICWCGALWGWCFSFQRSICFNQWVS